MSRYYGEIQGSRGEASRMGTASSGFHGHIRGWHVGCAVDMYPEGDDDRAAVYATAGSAGSDREPIGSVRNVDGTLELTPSAWTIAQVGRYQRAQRNEARREARAAAKLASTFPRTVETTYGTATIHADNVAVAGEHAQLHAWATRPGASWPCSTLRQFSTVVAWLDSNGLTDLQGHDGEAPAGEEYSTDGIAGDELTAWMSDVLVAANLPADHPAYDVAVGQFKTTS